MEEVAAAEVKIEDIDEVGINGTIHHRQETDEMTGKIVVAMIAEITIVIMTMIELNQEVTETVE